MIKEDNRILSDLTLKTTTLFFVDDTSVTATRLLALKF